MSEILTTQSRLGEVILGNNTMDDNLQTKEQLDEIIRGIYRWLNSSDRCEGLLFEALMCRSAPKRVFQSSRSEINDVISTSRRLHDFIDGEYHSLLFSTLTTNLILEFIATSDELDLLPYPNNEGDPRPSNIWDCIESVARITIANAYPELSKIAEWSEQNPDHDEGEGFLTHSFIEAKYFAGFPKYSIIDRVIDHAREKRAHLRILDQSHTRMLNEIMTANADQLREFDDNDYFYSLYIKRLEVRSDNLADAALEDDILHLFEGPPFLIKWPDLEIEDDSG